MAHKLIRVGYTQIIPANPGRPPTPPRTVAVTDPVTGSLPSGGSGGSWVFVPASGKGSIGYGTSGKYTWVPN